MEAWEQKQYSVSNQHTKSADLHTTVVNYFVFKDWK